MDVLDEVRVILARYSPAAAAEPPTLSTRLADLGMSSGEIVEAALDLEDRFSISLEPGELPRSADVAMLVGLVQAALAKSGS